jgi:hypothetical protein
MHATSKGRTNAKLASDPLGHPAVSSSNPHRKLIMIRATHAAGAIILDISLH